MKKNEREVLIIRIRNLMMTREMNLMRARHDLEHGDGWRSDYGQYDRDINTAIEELIKRLEDDNG